MFQFPIGVILDSFRTDTATAIEKAAALGADGVQLYCTKGENSPENLTPAKRRELLDRVTSAGLRFSALCGDLGEGFFRPERNPELIERYGIMQEACFELSRYADSIGSHFAIETGPETSAVLKQFLDGLHSTGVAVNLDPANLVMVTGDDPVQAVYNLKDYIVHTHAKDGVMLHRTNPEYIYRVTPRPEDLEGIRFFREVPLGEGSVDFKAYLRALEDIGYRGFLTIEREAGEDPAADIRTAKEHLLRVIAEN